MKLYVSGICYAEFDPFSDKAPARVLDTRTGDLRSERLMDAQLSEELSTCSHMNIAGLPGKLREAEEKLQGAPADFTLSNGARYEKKADGLYIQRGVYFPEDLLVRDGKIVGVITPGRDMVSILCADGYEDETVLKDWKELYPEAPHAVKEPEVVYIPMRDGIKLATDIILPADAEGPLPCVLIRTPYGRKLEGPNWQRLAQRGFMVAVQDTRGREDSEGEWEPLFHEAEDGSDTLDYLAADPRCSGSIGMIGGSYLGFVQWQAAATKNPHLKCLVSEVTAGSAYDDLPRKGGTMGAGMAAWAFAMSERRLDFEKMVRDDWDEVLASRPLEDVCVKNLGYEVPFWRTWVSAPMSDPVWKKTDWYHKALENGGVEIPVLIQSGWFDDDGPGTTEALDLTADYPDGRRKVIMGPWIHGGNNAYDIHGVELGQNAVRYDLDLWYFRWLEKHLNGRDCIPQGTPAVEYFTIGDDRWRQAKNWPPETGSSYALYLDTGAQLKESPSEEHGEDTLIYDPKNPATHIIDMSENEVAVPEDYAEQEKRADYLTFTTEPLGEDLVITGDVRAKLWISSDAPDTDLVVRITRVDDAGRSIKLADAILDVKYREGFDKEVYMEEGEIYYAELRTGKFSAKFAKGERLRFTVTSSAINLSFPNSNTEKGFNSEETRIARNTIHYGKAYPSRIEMCRE